MSRTRLNIGSLGYLLARVQKKLRLSAIRNSNVHPTSAIEGGSQVVNTTMDRHSFCGYDCTLLNAEIGGFCSISDQVYVGGSGHPTDFVSTSPVFLSHRDSVKTKFSNHTHHHLPRTVIGHDVWIGFGARIRAGVTIGHGSVIGMGSVVTKDVPAYSIVAGNPARVVKPRFSVDISEALLESHWWEYDDEALRKAAVTFTDPESFLKAAGYL